MNSADVGSIFTIFGIAWIGFTTIFWMVVCWRAMKAHEKLAQNSDEGIQALRAWWKRKRDE